MFRAIQNFFSEWKTLFMSVWPFARLWGMMRFTVSHAHCVRASLSSSVDIQKCYDLPFVQVFCDWQHYMSHWDSRQLLWHLMFEQIAFYSTITLFAQFSCHLRSLSSSAFVTSLCLSILNMPHRRCLQCFQVLSTVVKILTCANFKHWALALLFSLFLSAFLTAIVAFCNRNQDIQILVIYRISPQDWSSRWSEFYEYEEMRNEKWMLGARSAHRMAPLMGSSHP